MEKEKGFDWDHNLASKLKVIAIFAMALVFLGGLYQEALSIFATTFSYSREKVTRVVDLLEKNQATVDKLEQWYDGEYVIRCKLIRSILEHTEKEKITREFLDKLCDCLEIRTISVYDTKGRKTITNSLRKQAAIPDDSPAAVLLEGCESFVGTKEKDEISGETLQTIGVPLWNSDGTVGGMILIVDLSESIERVESIPEEELPRIHDKLCEISGSDVGGPKYRGVSKITETGFVLSFAIYCKGMYYGWLQRQLNRELKIMCERRGIRME
jgi:hypothetical protein